MHAGDARMLPFLAWLLRWWAGWRPQWNSIGLVRQRVVDWPFFGADLAARAGLVELSAGALVRGAQFIPPLFSIRWRRGSPCTCIQSQSSLI
jgi:hypothetical protein